MSDLEQRLTDALTEGARGAPSALGLAGAARGRARRRRRNRLVGAAAVVALAIAVPATVLAAGGSDRPDSSRVATDPEPAAPDVPVGYRVESWHSVSIEVPDTWGYGSLDAWCAGGGSFETPRVSRPGDVSEMIACSPEHGYGITFQEIDNGDDFQWPSVQQDPDAGWAPGAYVGGRGIGGVLVMVSLPSKEEALAVLATMRPIQDVDSNGCPSSVAEDGPDVPDNTMTVCRYDDQGLLEQSEMLSGDEVAAALRALEEAPRDTADCAPASDEKVPVIRLRSTDQHADLVLGGGCPGIRGLQDGDRALTADVLYWALSPGWSGSVPDGVSLPSVLRSP